MGKERWNWEVEPTPVGRNQERHVSHGVSEHNERHRIHLSDDRHSHETQYLNEAGGHNAASELTVNHWWREDIKMCQMSAN